MEGGSCGRTHLEGFDYGGDSDTLEPQDGGEAKALKPYIVDGKKYKMKFGSRRQVFNGTAYQTKGNLKQKDIKKNKQERFVSVKKSLMATKEQRLLKYGYGAKKGKFGYVRVKPMGISKRKKSASARKKSASARKKSASARKSASVLVSPVSTTVATPVQSVVDEPGAQANSEGILASRRVGIVRRMKKTKRKTRRRGAKRKSATKRKRASRGFTKGRKGRR